MQDRVHIPVCHSDHDFVMVVVPLYDTRKLGENWQSFGFVQNWQSFVFGFQIQKECYTNQMKPTV